MKINVTCFGHLAVFHVSGQSLEIEKGTVADELPDILGFSKKDAAMFFVGEQRVDPDYVITNGDIIKIFPPITGG
ncbi:molybdopterin synthase sulfur carrier subunit [Maridesulfovibrio ferrireducens]|uniref:Molybdopterin synthase sulfur carrier subunit n=1 Tax=Maridesulfovibrio ferrireducens TaxID=246191 RepID=A0A1G9FB18_9BACT|nr:MoaD/ThiS family protein [Maridesulfovibrio ferrireducens]SDK85540.1 molybdopterin synthase sulfur carrier subunit [Maridesulfovibrio ferrireducens]